MSNKITILYVDDESINCMLFEMNFKRKYNILTASSGFDGLEKLNANPSTTIVISDMKMPGMNGIEFIRRAKKNYPEIVFYILTGFDFTDEIAGVLSEQLIKNYFCKPFNMSEIETAIKDAVN
jgi:two-component system response regulator (stage 0 sporulation protein F)